ncbi:MAG TPA: pitrilysin family protein [Thermoanaerobaculia bacterium]|jgi:zinc protease|nr:pitrilysin family protein [Thermoanaerobaculia bacterium]
MSRRPARFLVAAGCVAWGLAASGSAAFSQADKASELRFPPLRETTAPTPQRVVLDNGLTVLLLEDHELPLVDATAFIRIGSLYEPADKVGLAELTGRVLRTGGTQRQTGDEIDDFLENRAATIETSISEDMGMARLSALREDFSDVFQTFADVLRRPAFDATKIELARNRSMSEIARQNDDPQDILDRKFREIVFGKDSPEARMPTFASLAGIRRADLVAWHAKYFHPERVVLGIVGDIDVAATLARVREAFGDWPRGAALEEPKPDSPHEVKPGVYTVDLEEIPQANIAMGYLGIRRDDPDFFAVEVLNQLFGGGFSSRLFANVRSKKALGYVVFGGVTSEWGRPDVTELLLTTKAETTGAGVAALLEEAKGLSVQPPSDTEVEEAKKAILSSFVFTRDSVRKTLRQQLTLQYWGYPADWYERYRLGVEAVTTDQVRRAAERLIHPEKFAIVVVGPAAPRERPLSDFGPVTPLDITIPGAPKAPKQP